MKRILCLLFCLLLVTACEREDKPPKFDHPIVGEWYAKEYYIPYDGRTISCENKSYSFRFYDDGEVLHSTGSATSGYYSEFEFIDDKYFFLNLKGEYKYDGDIQASGVYLEILELTPDTLRLYEWWYTGIRSRIWTLYRTQYFN